MEMAAATVADAPAPPPPPQPSSSSPPPDPVEDEEPDEQLTRPQVNSVPIPSISPVPEDDELSVEQGDAEKNGNAYPGYVWFLGNKDQATGK